MSDAGTYVGSELSLFAHAVRWKRYWSSRIRRYIGSSVIEVGAGLGSNTTFMNDGSASSWECAEPDEAMSRHLEAARQRGELPGNVVVTRGTLESRGGVPVDTIIYIDVLEHIEDDRDEFRRAASSLTAGGHLIVLAPAHQWLYSAFDAAIGHHRRYTKRSLLRLNDAELELELVEAFYLDSVGLLASAVNRFMLRSANPSRAQIALWDGVLVSLSRVVDVLTLGSFGKTVVAVWRRR